MTNTEHVDIHELLPQKEPFVLIDRLLAFDFEEAVSDLTVRADNIFVEDGALSVYGLIENVAQTCAAKIGYYNRFILGKDILIGVIGAIKKFNTFRLPAVGESLRTTVTTVEEVMGMSLVTGKITVNRETIAYCEMKIAVGTIQNQ